MRSNNATALGGYAATNYGEALDSAPDKRCSTIAGLCSPAEMVINDRYEWIPPSNEVAAEEMTFGGGYGASR